MAKNSNIYDGGLIHFGLTRLRVTGSGLLRQTFFSLDDVKSDILFPVTMAAATDIEPTKLANFTQQRACLEVKTTNFNESFVISRIIMFVKPVANSLPG